ncbi:hypothetical protein KIPB_004396 [Kipferlia bialata]|uniref:Leucine-rich repeat-containing N-terminal plant-type domain-containing protein n=1 Tax=Kipferlia bialata TaxID=797122 RepID=A0A9K3CTY7_9EUKA|nr:hypothetical protein KIPB_004396 [Kipferlia bialata]|eukprot:g4396.t1
MRVFVCCLILLFLLSFSVALDASASITTPEGGIYLASGDTNPKTALLTVNVTEAETELINTDVRLDIVAPCTTVIDLESVSVEPDYVYNYPDGAVALRFYMGDIDSDAPFSLSLGFQVDVASDAITPFLPTSAVYAHQDEEIGVAIPLEIDAIPVHFECPATPEAALAMFYQAAGGDNWTNNTGWTGTDVCEYFGVICECDSYVPGVCTPNTVKELHLSDNNLIGYAHPALQCLPQLKTLYLRNNGLRGAIHPLPEHMQHLDLTGNHFGQSRCDDIESGTNIDPLCALPYLKYALLDNNRFTGALPECLQSMQHLKSLRLECNEINGEVPDMSQLVPGQMGGLREVTLAGNALECPQWIDDLHHSSCGVEDATCMQFRPAGDVNGDWWNWASIEPLDNNPMSDTTGERCGLHQDLQTAWYLAGTQGLIGPVVRDCAVEYGRDIVVPVFNGYFSEPDDSTLEGLRLFYNSVFTELTNPLQFTLDGVTTSLLPPIEPSYYYESKPYIQEVLDGSIFDYDVEGLWQAGGGGYYVVIPNLSMGEHSLRVYAEVVDFGLVVDVTYNLTIV